MFNCLLKHGCVDLSSSMDPNQYSSVAVAGGSFGDIWRGMLRDGTEVAIKCLRFHVIAQDSSTKGLKVRVGPGNPSRLFPLRARSYLSVRCVSYTYGRRRYIGMFKS